VFACCAQDRFLLALQQYLQKHSYHNTQATDLWAAMGGAGAALS
jgi:aminopeptidase N